MGSLGKSSKAPAPVPAQQVVYYTPPPVAAPAPAAEPVPTDEDVSTTARRDNLLRRSRGRIGTILTGFRGLLTPADSAGQRKTLLGE